MSPQERRRRLLFLTGIAPLVLFLVLFLAFPLLQLFQMSFFTFDRTNMRQLPGFTLSNYLKMISPYFSMVTVRTLWMGFAVTFLTALGGYPVAYFLSRTRLRYKPLLFALVISPFMINGVVTAFSFLVILSPTGLLGTLGRMVGLSGINLMYTQTSMVLGMSYFLFPFMVLPLFTAFQDIHPSFEEAAMSMGASHWHIFRKVVFPLSIPGFLAGTSLVFSMMMTRYAVPHMLGGGNIKVITNLVADYTLEYLDWTGAAAISMFLISLIVLVLFGYHILAARAGVRR